MRRIFAMMVGLGLVAGAGCHHHTCDDCNHDICAGCGHSRMYVVPAQPAPVKPEGIEAMPKPKE